MDHRPSSSRHSVSRSERIGSPSRNQPRGASRNGRPRSRPPRFGQGSEKTETRSSTQRPGSQEVAAVFLNLPYHPKYEDVLVSLISGYGAFGIEPRLAAGPGSDLRITRLLNLIAACRYSVHDLSFVGTELRDGFRVPKGNCFFELGLTVASHERDLSGVLVLERRAGRIRASLSNINGIDAKIYRSATDLLHRVLSEVYRTDVRITVSLLKQVRVHVVREYRRLKTAGHPVFDSHFVDHLYYIAAIATRELLASRHQ